MAFLCTFYIKSADYHKRLKLKLLLFVTFSTNLKLYWLIIPAIEIFVFSNLVILSGATVTSARFLKHVYRDDFVTI